MKHLQISLGILMLFTIRNGAAQSTDGNEMDSLLNVAYNASVDSNRVKAYDRLSKYYGWRIGEFETSIRYANEGLKIAIESGFEKGKAYHYTHLGVSNMYLGNYAEALQNYELALSTWEVVGLQRGVASAHNNIGLLHQHIGNYPIALDHFLQAVKVYESLEMTKRLAPAFHNIGTVHHRLGHPDEALKYYHHSLDVELEYGDEHGVATSYNNIGLVHQEQGRYNKAFEYLRKSLKIRSKIEDESGEAACYHNMAIVYGLTGHADSSLAYLLKSVEIRERSGAKRELADTYTAIAELLLKTDRVDEATEWLQKSVLLGKEISNPESLKSAYFTLYKVDSALGNPQRALNHYKLHVLYRDSILNQETTRKTVQLEMRAEFDKKEAVKNLEIEKQNAQIGRQRIALSSAVVGLFLILSLAYTIRRGKRKSDELLLNILPTETAKELKEKGRADAKQFDEVTVLFTDFKGFTEIAEKLNPQELVAEIDECFCAFDRIMDKYGIEKIKTIGDAYMAAGGLPSPSSDHAIKVVEAALEIRDFMILWGEMKVKEGKPHFEIRIGVHTGPVVAGIVGIKKFQYDIWGDTVNTAARMESGGDVSRVNISESTYQLVKEQFVCEHRGKIMAKGKGEIDMYFVESRV